MGKIKTQTATLLLSDARTSYHCVLESVLEDIDKSHRKSSNQRAQTGVQPTDLSQKRLRPSRRSGKKTTGYFFFLAFVHDHDDDEQMNGSERKKTTMVFTRRWQEAAAALRGSVTIRFLFVPRKK
jgi:hypothetical protein